MFKPFFVHRNRPVRKTDSSAVRHAPRGFTAYISSSEKERCISIQVTMCSAKDEFIKAHGRSFALAAEKYDINPRDLPKFVSRLEAHIYDVKDSDVFEKDFLYLLKYVV